MRLFRLAVAITLLSAVTGRAGADDDPPADSRITFEEHIRPLLKLHCFQCHGEEPEKLKARLDVRLKRLILKGGKRGPAIVPGRSADSLLVKRLRNGEMPPDGKHPLSQENLDLIARWIDAGAPTARPEPEMVPHAGEPTPEERAFWSFQPIRRPPVPALKDRSRIRTPIDAFLLARMKKKGLSFSPDADKKTLIRRAAYDLTGLPPTPEEVSAFLADAAPDAYARLLDRLLSSAPYGERWGRHWLDIAGYSDSEGYDNKDVERRHVWRYRDYVIRSFNADKPMDRFIREQLAGDEMVSPPYGELPPEGRDTLIATGFLRLGPDGTGGKDVDQGVARNKAVADSIQIVSTSLLGLTVGCARCHDHRYDPIPQADYYRFRAILEPAYDVKNWRVPKDRRISLYSAADRRKAAEIEKEGAKIDARRKKKEKEYVERTFEKELVKLPENLRESARKARGTPVKKRTVEQKKLLKQYPKLNVSAGSLYLYDKKAADDLKKIAAEAAKVRAKKPKEGFVRATTEVPGKVPTTHVFHRGDHEQPSKKVDPAELTVLPAFAIADNSPSLPTSGRRLAYARHLTNGKHPLTARVLVNRVWMHHLGRGIVATPADFGHLGERPTHPDLLDWLADEFMARGWSLKKLHRLIMTSTAYRQASRREPRVESVDPDNLLYARMSVRRLEAEVIRDTVLAVSGKINLKMFGSQVPVMADEVGQWVIGKENLNAGRPQGVISMNGEEFRRSIYVMARRSRPLAILDTFDSPAMDPNCELRNVSTVAPQALMFMNSRFTTVQADHFARRVRHDAGDDAGRQIVRAWRLAYASEPTAGELKEARAFLKAQADHFRKNPPPVPKPAKGKKPVKPVPPELLALSSFCQALLSSNHFLYVD